MKRLLFVLLLVATVLAREKPTIPDGASEFPAAQNAWEYWVAKHDGVELRVAPSPAAWQNPQPSTWKVAGKLKDRALLHAQQVVVDKEALAWLKCTYNGKLYAVRATYEEVDPTELEPMKFDADGNFLSPSLHMFFKVVDPTGLNGRWSQTDAHPGEDVPWPRTDINTWPVKKNFPPGTILIGIQGNRGILFPTNVDGQTWMVAGYGSSRHKIEYVLVRANLKYLKPVDGP